MSQLTILPNMNKFHHMVSEELHQQRVTDGGRPSLCSSVAERQVTKKKLFLFLLIP